METSNQKIPEAIILEIQRMSTEDGPGIRTTVFFKGCSLKCLWCHNPESISSKPQPQWMENRCIQCRICLDACPNKALSESMDRISISRDKCEGCGTCTEECPSTAMELMGKNWSVDELAEEVFKDRVYYEKSCGGVTVSGGEPVLQADFVMHFLQRCKENGIHTALDTCGHCRSEALEKILPYTDLVLYDLKEIDPEHHEVFTGCSNTRILENLKLIRTSMKDNHWPQELWIRTAIIPETTDREENIDGIGRFLSTHLNNYISRWELCAFNNLCRDKYARLGVEWIYQKSPLLPADKLEDLAHVARQSGVDPSIVHTSGDVQPSLDNSTQKTDTPNMQLLK